jgi:hypothetical protein
MGAEHRQALVHMQNIERAKLAPKPGRYSVHGVGGRVLIAQQTDRNSVMDGQRLGISECEYRLVKPLFRVRSRQRGGEVEHIAFAAADHRIWGVMGGTEMCHADSIASEWRKIGHDVRTVTGLMCDENDNVRCEFPGRHPITAMCEGVACAAYVAEPEGSSPHTPVLRCILHVLARQVRNGFIGCWRLTAANPHGRADRPRLPSPGGYD